MHALPRGLLAGHRQIRGVHLHDRGGRFIRQAAAALEKATDPDAGALDAVAAAFQLLSTDWEPIGTGPYRFVSETAAGSTSRPGPGYHGGLAATRYVDFVPTNADGSDLMAGTVDILQGGTEPRGGLQGHARAAAAFGWRTRRSAGLLSRSSSTSEPGRLFADRDLRRALQLCIDLPRDVDAATGGSAPRLRPSPSRQLGRRSRPPEAGTGHGRRRAPAHRGGRLAARSRRHLREGGLRLAADILFRGDSDPGPGWPTASPPTRATAGWTRQSGPSSSARSRRCSARTRTSSQAPTSPSTSTSVCAP